MKVNPWKILEFRAKLDELFLEREVIDHAKTHAPEILSATALAIWLFGRAQGAGDRPLVFSGHSELRAQEALAQRCISEAKPIRVDANDYLLCVPLVDLDTVIGAMLVKLHPLARPDDAEYLAFARQIAAAIRRARRLEAYREITQATSKALETDRQLESMLQQITDLKWEYAVISIADQYDIAAVRGKNVPPEWLKAAVHGLEDKDIVPTTLASGLPTKRMEGYDPAFDPEIYWKFGHTDIARMFAPMMIGKQAIGVVEFGCNRRNKANANHLFATQVTGVETIIKDMTNKDMTLVRPNALLERIAGYAMDALGAGSASIHVYDIDVRKQPQTLPKPFLFGGAGKATPSFLRKFSPRENGFGHAAMREGKIVTKDDSDIKNDHPDLYDQAIRALAAVPLHFEGQDLSGVLYLHFWSAHEFRSSEREVARIFVRQVEVAIYNHLLIERTRERHERVWANSRLLDILQALKRSDEGGQEILELIARNVLQVLGADNVVLYEYSSVDEKFHPPVWDGFFKHLEELSGPLPGDGVASHVVRVRKASLFASDVNHPDYRDLLVAPREGRKRFVVREGIVSCAVLLLQDENDIVGTMFVNYRKPQSFENKAELETLAASAAIAINGSRRREREIGRQARDQLRRDRELEAMRTVHGAVTRADPRNFAQSLQLILNRSLEVVEADWGVMMWLDPGRRKLTSGVYRKGFEDDRKFPIEVGIDQGIVGWVARTGESALIKDIGKDERFKHIYNPVIPSTVAELAVPIMSVPGDRSTVLGVINCESPRANVFNDGDRTFLEAIARQLVMALSLFGRLRQIDPEQVEALVREEVTATADQDAAIRVVLTGITAGEGLGFSRAMVFVADRSEPPVLRGHLAIGALTRPEAEAIWRGLEAGRAAARPDLTPEDGDWPLRGSEGNLRWLLKTAGNKGTTDNPLTKFLRSYGPDTKQNDGALATCAGAQKDVTIPADQDDPFKRELKKHARPSATPTDIVCVPLLRNGKTLGVLVVDDEFLPEVEPAIRLWRRPRDWAEALRAYAAILSEILARSL